MTVTNSIDNHTKKPRAILEVPCPNHYIRSVMQCQFIELAKTRRVRGILFVEIRNGSAYLFDTARILLSASRDASILPNAVRRK